MIDFNIVELETILDGLRYAHGAPIRNDRHCVQCSVYMKIYQKYYLEQIGKENGRHLIKAYDISGPRC